MIPATTRMPLRISAAAGLLISVVFAAVTLLSTAGGELGWRFHIDASVYRAGGQLVLDGARLYEGRLPVGGEETGTELSWLPFTYPPFAALLFVPLTGLTQAAVGVVTVVANVVLAWVIVAMLVDAATPPRWRGRRAWLLACAVLPLALLAEPVRETIFFGQINLLLMALVVLGTVARTPLARTWGGGTLIGLAAAIKLTPAVFGLYFLIHRRWGAALASVVSFFAFTALAAVVLPQDSWSYWTSTLQDTDRIGDSAYAANQSFKGVLTRMLDPGNPAGSTIWLVAAVVTAIAVAVGMLRLRGMSADEGLMKVNTLALASMIASLASPVSWSHHWVWLLAAVIGLVGAATAAHGAHRVIAVTLAGLTGAITLVGPHWLLPNSNNAELFWPWWAQLTGSSFVVVGVLLVLTALITPRALVPARDAAAVGTTGVPPPPARLARAWARVLVVVAAAVTAGITAAVVY